MRIIIGHKRFKSASRRVTYQGKEKTVKSAAIWRVLYNVSEKEQEVVYGPRVGRYWGKLPGGKAVSGDPIRDALNLMVGSKTEGRSEVIEILVSAEGPEPREEQLKSVEEIVNRMMETFFQGRPFLCTIHTNSRLVHGHALLVNDAGDGRAIQLSRKEFLRLRRDIKEWTRGLARSGWGRCKKAERELAMQTGAAEEIGAMVARGELQVQKTKGKLAGLVWLRGMEQGRETIRLYQMMGLLGTTDQWLAMQIELGLRLWYREQERVRASAIVGAVDLIPEQEVEKEKSLRASPNPPH